VNVLFVDQYSEMGGAQHCLLDLVPGALQRGWQCCAALPGSGPLVSRLAAAGVPVERIACGPYSYGRKSVLDYARFFFDVPQAAAQIRGMAKARGVELVYCNGPRVLPAASLCGLPLMYHAHSVLARGHDLWMVKRSLRGAKVLAASDFVAQSLRSFCSPHVVANGTEDLEYRPWRGGDPLRIGVIGRIAPEKGQLEFVEAVRILTAENARCRFVICGEAVVADPAYSEEVKRQAAGLPIDFAGGRETPRSAMDTVDLLVVPAGPNEAFGRVVVEAFSAGIPVVAFAAGGIPELIDDGRTGFLVLQRTGAALASRLREMLAAPELLDRVTRAARAEWERRYTVERYRDQVLALMEETFFRSKSQNNSPATPATTPADKSIAG